MRINLGLVLSGPDIRLRLDNRLRRNQRRLKRSYKVIIGHRRSWKVMEGHGRSWKVMEGKGWSRKVMNRLFPLLD